jgi:hypothetical protein
MDLSVGLALFEGIVFVRFAAQPVPVDVARIRGSVFQDKAIGMSKIAKEGSSCHPVQ